MKSRLQLPALVLFSLLSLGGLPATAHAQSGDVKVSLSAARIVAGKDGKEQRIPANQARPGDLLEYTAVYQNAGKGEVRALNATLPIPPGLVIVPGSTKPATALASTDGTTFAAAPLQRVIAGQQQPVPVNEYRAVRWLVPALAAGASTTVTVRARVVSGVPLASR